MSYVPRQFGAVAVGLLASLGVLAVASPANAQFVANRYEPAEKGSDWFVNDSLDMRGTFRPSLGLVLEYAKDNADLLGPDGSVQQRLVADQLYLHLGASAVLFDRVRLGADVPFALFQYGFFGAPGAPTPPRSAAIGDIRIGADLRIWGEYAGPFQIAVGGQVWVPSGPDDLYTGDTKVRGGPHLLIAGDIGVFAYALRGGWNYRGNRATFQSVNFDNEITGGAAAGVRILDRKLLVGPELNFSTSESSAFTGVATPAEALLGLHAFLGDFKIHGGAGVGLDQGFGSPNLRVIVGLDWIPFKDVKPSDRDGDGIPDSEDACPDQAGIRTDDPKTNGCPPPPPPPPPDTDGDGILDMNDACPDKPGVPTNDPKTNGCPVLDRDKDGIPDNEDACPDVPGVKTNDPKTNGCPPPDPDRDHDGIPNEVDACPDEPGPANPDPKKNGCPLAFVSQGQIKITEQVKFAVDSARILKDSDNLMGAVLKILSDHPEIKLVRVEGHTDNTGSAAHNKTLSGQRAAAVVGWLTLHGVDKARLQSEGFGAERPIDSNATAEGRQNNRRVEFHIDKQEGAPATTAPAPSKSPAAPPATPPSTPPSTTKP